jgi:hypothetical protein
MKNIVYSIFISLVLISCGSSVSFQREKIKEPINKPDTVSFKNFWAALVTYSPDKAAKLANSHDHAKLSVAMKDVINNKIDKAMPELQDLFKNCKNDTVKALARRMLYQLYMYKSSPNEIWSALRDSSDNDTTMTTAYPTTVFKDFPKPNIDMVGESDTIPFEIRKGLAFVKVKINGKDAELLFDTGAQMTMFSDELAEELGIKPLDNKIKFGGSTGYEMQTRLAFIDKMKIGATAINNLGAVISPSEAFRFKFLFFTFFSFDGVLGFDFIKRFDVTIDRKRNVLILRKPRALDVASQNMFWLNDPYVVFKAENGTDVVAMFDTGSRTTDGCDNFCFKLGIDNDSLSTTSRRFWGAGGSVNIDGYYMDSVNLYLADNKIKISNFSIFNRYELSDSQFRFYDMMLGFDFFDNKVVRFDINSGKFEICEW